MTETYQYDTGFRFPHEVEGYLAQPEGRWLFERALETPAYGVIVELGTYKGRSACCFVQAGRPLICVDSFEGEELEGDAVHGDHFNGTYTREQTMENIGRYSNSSATFTVLSWDTADAVKLVSGPVDLLFVDGAHDYESVKRDVEAWLPRLHPEGRIIFHDRVFPGVARFLIELMRGDRAWQQIEGPGTLALLYRRTTPSSSAW